jgi:DNA-binding response OmpR family regulator
MPKILVVDDETDILMVVERRLQLAGYDVITASNGYDGLAAARSEGPDAIVLDLMLPGIDGQQICTMLKRDLRFRDVPIVILSARSQLKDVETSMQCGADAYVSKPFDYKVLLEQLEKLLARRGTLRAAPAERCVEPPTNASGETLSPKP